MALSFLNLIFVGVVSLFPPVNPVGTALMVDPFLNSLSRKGRRAAAIKIALYCLSICVCTLLVGSWLFKLFGISLPVVQVAGGILICKMGWELLSAKGDVHSSEQEASSPETISKSVENILFYPLAFPMTTGAGTISVLLTLSAHGESVDFTNHLMNLSALFVSVLIICAIIFLCYAYTPALLRRLGPRGGVILNRLSAFLVFCVGIQIGSNGVLHLIHS